MTETRFPFRGLAAVPAALRAALVPLAVALMLLAVLIPQQAAAQADDAYRPPPGGGGSFEQQLKQGGFDVPPPAGDFQGPPPSGGQDGGGGQYQGPDGFTAEGGLRGTQRQGTVAPIPIAIPMFVGDDPQLAADVAHVVMADLERTGLFQPLDPASFLENIRDVNALPRFPDWRQIGAEEIGRAHV